MKTKELSEKITVSTKIPKNISNYYMTIVAP